MVRELHLVYKLRGITRELIPIYKEALQETKYAMVGDKLLGGIVKVLYSSLCHAAFENHIYYTRKCRQ